MRGIFLFLHLDLLNQYRYYYHTVAFDRSDTTRSTTMIKKLLAGFVLSLLLVGADSAQAITAEGGKGEKGSDARSPSDKAFSEKKSKPPEKKPDDQKKDKK